MWLFLCVLFVVFASVFPSFARELFLKCIWEKRVWQEVVNKLPNNVQESGCPRKSSELVDPSRKSYVCVMHHVCLSDFLLVPLGLLMNRHALPIEVKVAAVINPPTRASLWWEATSVWPGCQLHYPPAGVVFVHVVHVGLRLRGTTVVWLQWDVASFPPS